MDKANFVPRFDYTNSIHGLSFRELDIESGLRSRTANHRIRELAKKRNYYSSALVKRYRIFNGIPKQTEVSWEDVIEAAYKGKLNFTMTPGFEIKENGNSYDINSLIEYFHNVTNFLNSRTSTITGIREYLQQTKTNFGGLMTDPELTSHPEGEQTFALREAFDIMDEIDLYLKENAGSIDNSIIADEIANGSPLRASMTVSDFVEILRGIAGRLTVSMDVVNEEFFKDTGYKLEKW